MLIPGPALAGALGSWLPQRRSRAARAARACRACRVNSRDRCDNTARPRGLVDEKPPGQRSARPYKGRAEPSRTEPSRAEGPTQAERPGPGPWSASAGLGPRGPSREGLRVKWLSVRPAVLRCATPGYALPGCDPPRQEATAQFPAAATRHQVTVLPRPPSAARRRVCFLVSRRGAATPRHLADRLWRHLAGRRSPPRRVQLLPSPPLAACDGRYRGAELGPNLGTATSNVELAIKSPNRLSGTTKLAVS